MLGGRRRGVLKHVSRPVPVVTVLSLCHQIAIAVVHGATEQQTDDAPVQISLAEIVVSKAAPNLGDTISRIFRYTVRQSPHCILPVIDRRATAVAARVVDIRFRHTWISLVTDRGVVLRPGGRGPLLLHTAGPDLAQRGYS